MEAPDRRLARRPGEQRTHRGGQQLDQAGEACRLRVHLVPELPDPVTALRREAQLGSAQNDQTGGHSENRQTPLISEEPPIPQLGEALSVDARHSGQAVNRCFQALNSPGREVLPDPRPRRKTCAETYCACQVEQGQRGCAGQAGRRSPPRTQAGSTAERTGGAFADLRATMATEAGGRRSSSG